MADRARKVIIEVKVRGGNINSISMAITVVKKDGAKVSFNQEKIRQSVRMAATRAGLSETRVAEAVNRAGMEVMKIADAKEEVSTVELRNAIFGALKSMEPSVVESWQKYESEKKRNI